MLSWTWRRRSPEAAKLMGQASGGELAQDLNNLEGDRSMRSHEDRQGLPEKQWLLSRWQVFESSTPLAAGLVLLSVIVGS